MDRPHVLAALAAGAVFIGVASPLMATTLPQGFSEEVIARGLDLPTDVAFAPDGRLFIVEKRGTVRVVDKNGLRPTPFISIDDEVNNAGDRGLLSIVLDPDFLNNGYVYLLYAVDPIYGAPEESADEPTFGRLTRYTATASSGLNVADPGSRLVLIGATPGEGIPSCYNTHSIGAVRFGPDGKLLVSAGDGASKDYIDWGQNVSGYSPRCEELFGASQDIGALRSQSLDTLAGKILRIDPRTGQGLSDNPFYNGDAKSVRSRVFALGLRQPFKFTVRPGSTAPGVIYLGDVGSSNYEELDMVRKGDNLGWPCYEGNSPMYLYQENPNTAATCAGVPSSGVRFPISAWSHSDDRIAGFTGSAAIGGVFYTGTRYPAQYQGRLYFADYTESWIRSVPVSGSDVAGSSELFASNTNAPVGLNVDPLTGNLVYISIETGEVRMIHYQQAAHNPVASFLATPTEGYAPLSVRFDASSSSDADGDALSYSWNFGDGATGTGMSVTHLYATPGTYTATLLVTDATSRTNSASTTIAVDNTAPEASILSPDDGYQFYTPADLTLEATATDAEQAQMPNNAFVWSVDLHHGTHVHYDWFVGGGPLTTMRVEPHGEDDVYYEITLTVTDNGGLVGEDRVYVYPMSVPPDTDGDGLTDQEESELGTNPTKADTDGDGLSDKAEVSEHQTNPLKPDSDEDGLVDGDELTRGLDPLDADSDDDGLSDGLEVENGTDPARADTDGDGLTDSQEANAGTDPLKKDTDDDGLEDKAEIIAGTDPLLEDSDADGLSDGEELTAGTDPLNGDTDADGIPDPDEIEAGTDPLKGDTDADGISDPDEIAGGTDPTASDTDRDGLTDGDEILVQGTDPTLSDSDGDGLTDGDEVHTHQTDPLNADTDGDGSSDGNEVRSGTDPLDPASHPGSGGCSSASNGRAANGFGMLLPVGALLVQRLRRRRDP